jgi:translation initiation factor 2B subunit (eIF-2B alpha/beta/delta family)
MEISEKSYDTMYRKIEIQAARIAELETGRSLLTNYIVELEAQVASLTAANENERKLNDAAFLDNMAALKKQADEIAALKAALIKISKTTVTMGDSKSAFIMWRACCTTANDALKE